MSEAEAWADLYDHNESRDDGPIKPGDDGHIIPGDDSPIFAENVGHGQSIHDYFAVDTAAGWIWLQSDWFWGGGAVPDGGGSVRIAGGADGVHQSGVSQW